MAVDDESSRLRRPASTGQVAVAHAHAHAHDHDHDHDHDHATSRTTFLAPQGRTRLPCPWPAARLTPSGRDPYDSPTMSSSKKPVAALAFLVLAAGCGSEAPVSMPGLFLGRYDVEVTALGKTDTDQMNAVLGAGNTVLLTFVFGISDVRAQAIGTDTLSLPRQTIRVAHSTGTADGFATGDGTLVDDKLDLTLHLTPVGGGAPSGDGGAGGVVDYVISGTRTSN